MSVINALRRKRKLEEDANFQKSMENVFKS